ncbi:hypothetical protein HGA34_05425 [Candidatus Falkowbacteria bacterium]|nr:hypothetical protein [Candidatus Falkowbacteria bacterium]
MAKTKLLAKCLILAIFASTLSIRPALAAQDIWEAVTPAGAGGTFTTVASMDNYIYLGTSQGVYLSSNQGTSWSAAALGGSTINAIAIGWNYDGIAYTADGSTPIFVATNNGVYRTTLGSNSWTATSISDNTSDVKFDLYQTIFNAAATSIYAAGPTGVYRSDDLGDTNIQVSASSTKRIMTDFTGLTPGGNIFAITQNNEIFSSEVFSVNNNPETWTFKYATSTPINDLAPINGLDGSGFMATDNGVLKTMDGGINWDASNLNLPTLNTKSIQNDFIDTNIVFVAASSSGVYRSTNGGVGGEDWQAANNGLAATPIKMVNTNPASSTLLYAMGNATLFRLNLSGTAALVGPDTIAPEQIVSLSSFPDTPTSVILNWLAPGDDGAFGTASSYDLRYATTTIDDANWNNADVFHSTGEPTPAPAATDEAMIQGGLLPNTTYYFAIKTTDNAGNISALSTVSFVTTDGTAPSVPQSLATAPISASQIDLSWATSTDNVSVEGYKIYRDSVLIATTSSTTFSNTGLTNGTTYNYQVLAYDTSGNESAKSATSSAATTDTQAPTVPASLVASPISSSQINLSWATSTDNVAVTGYKVFRNNSQIATTTATTYNSTGLAASTTYNYQISAFDAAGNTSAKSATSTATTTAADVQAPSVPSSLAATVISSSQINLSWATSTDNVAVTGYNVYRNSTLIASTTGSTYSSTGLAASSLYTYQVSAYDAAGNESAKSTSTAATTQAAPSVGGGGGGGGAVTDTIAPAAPRYVSTERKDGNIKLSWSNPADADLGEIVVIKRETEATSSAYSIALTGGKITIVATSTAYSETDNDPTKKLFYYIYAKDKTGNISAALTMVVVPQNTSASGTTAPASASSTSAPAVTPASYEASVQSEAAIVYGQTSPSKLSDIEISIYNRITKGESLTANARYSIAYFINKGTASTIKLGAGERAGAVSSYRKAFGHLPRTTEDWMDAIKIGNGRWTKEISAKAEKDATQIFKKIYGRTPDLKNARDDAAVKVMAYGLRPSTRNQNSEKSAIKSFKAIFKKAPTLAADWDIVRAIAYSGAKR